MIRTVTGLFTKAVIIDADGEGNFMFIFTKNANFAEMLLFQLSKHCFEGCRVVDWGLGIVAWIFSCTFYTLGNYIDIIGQHKS